MRKPAVETLDLKFQGVAGVVASHLVKIGDECILIDVGPHSTFPALVDALKVHQLTPKDITKVLLTHIHLDHAGATWAIMQNSTKVYVHPNGRPHLIAPEKLINSATRIYGAKMHELWGTMEPIPEAQVFAVDDHQVLAGEDWEIRAHHTPGHASHYITWEVGSKQEQAEKYLFTGDVAGIRIGEIGKEVSKTKESLIQAAVPPPDLHFSTWLDSLNRLEACKAERLYLAHFGLVASTRADVTEHFHRLKEVLEKEASWCRDYLQKNAGNTSNSDVENFKKDFEINYKAWVEQQYHQKSLSLEIINKYKLINPSDMNRLGILRYFKKYEQLVG